MRVHKKISFLSASVVLGAMGILFVAGCSPEQNAAVEDAASNAADSASQAVDNAVGAVEEKVEDVRSSMGSSPTEAVAVLHPTEGSKVQGTVTFTKESDGVRVKANLSGLAPGKHGFHVHENGDCSAPDASSAGGHYNPSDQPHGGPHDDERHTGDFGNITADASGAATYEEVFKDLALEGGGSIIGRAVIVHAGEDDLKTQPTGDAGGRDACGVIGVKS